MSTMDSIGMYRLHLQSILDSCASEFNEILNSLTIDTTHLTNLQKIEAACLTCHCQCTGSAFYYCQFNNSMNELMYQKKLTEVDIGKTIKEASEKIIIGSICNKGGHTCKSNIGMNHLPDWRLSRLLKTVENIKYKLPYSDYPGGYYHLDEEFINSIRNEFHKKIEEWVNVLSDKITRYNKYLDIILHTVEAIDETTKSILDELKSKEQLEPYIDQGPVIKYIILPYPRYTKMTKHYDPDELPNI